ncbi:MAG TPA: response regulator [Candidatus Cloacimonadota bacterium]|nr:response regulator [Candidatus Cloacimonadota bacterium]
MSKEECYIMIIDDNVYTLKSVSNALEMNGYPARSYCNPLNAILDYNPERFPLVITDYQMPDASGLDILKYIRKIKHDAHIIIYTGLNDDSVSREIQKYGADEFYKPLDIEKLIQRIEEIMNKKEKK